MMTQALKVALFVEGSYSHDPKCVTPLERLWCDVIAARLELRRIDRIIGISKGELTMMDPKAPRCSGREPFDARLARELKREPFDSAVLAWDLLPPWGGAVTPKCRWLETKNVFRLLGESNEKNLPTSWKEKAKARFMSYEARTIPSARASLPVLEKYSILPVCMEPDFEGILMVNEAVIQKVLGVDGRRRPRDWPDWPRLCTTHQQMQKNVLQKAIASAQSHKPMPEIFRKLHGNMRTNAHEWAACFFKALHEDGRSRDAILAHPLVTRLQDVLKGNS